MRIKQISFYCSLLVVGLWCAAAPLRAQDIHFTQIQFAPHTISPSLLGSFVGHYRFGAILRDQWRAVPVPYTSVSLYHDQKTSLGTSPHHVGWGGAFTHDVAGDGRLTWSHLDLGGAFHYSLGDGQFLSAGLGAKVGQRAFSPAGLNWGDQFDGDVFDPDLTTGENLTETAAGFVDLTAGIGYQYQSEDARTELRGGFGVGHLNRPQLTFLNGMTVPFFVHHRLYAFGRVPLGDQYSGTFRLLLQKQGPYYAYAGSIGGGIDLATVNSLPLYVGLAASYRYQDAVGIGLEAQYRGWRLGFNYDITTSSFRQANRGRGGPEIALQYLIARPRAPQEFKACPIF